MIKINFDKQLTKNKAIEISTAKQSEWAWFDIMLKLDRKCDHAGFWFSFELFGLSFVFSIYDVRHWNYDTDKWNEGEEE